MTYIKLYISIATIFYAFALIHAATNSDNIWMFLFCAGIMLPLCLIWPRYVWQFMRGE